MFCTFTQSDCIITMYQKLLVKLGGANLLINVVGVFGVVVYGLIVVEKKNPR